MEFHIKANAVFNAENIDDVVVGDGYINKYFIPTSGKEMPHCKTTIYQTKGDGLIVNTGDDVVIKV
jgi:hypothetical protein